jgi:hypothetical protein
MRCIALFVLVLATPALGGCFAKTALDVATLPVKVASKGVDLATTSQSEADEKRGREIRQREERLGQLQRERDKLERRCAEGSAEACGDLEAVNREIEALLPQVPYEPED